MTPVDELRKGYIDGIGDFRDKPTEQGAAMLAGLTALYVIELIERQDRTNELLEQVIALQRDAMPTEAEAIAAVVREERMCKALERIAKAKAAEVDDGR